MAEQVTVTFQFALGQRVRYVGGAMVYTVVARSYEERQMLSPCIRYRLQYQAAVDRHWVWADADLEAVEEGEVDALPCLR